jgi:RNA polymerase sigma factor (sigma-70 family)
MDGKPDAELVSDSLAGDREAFSALVRKYQVYAYGVAISTVSDFDLARDVVQEAFLCAYRDLRKLREPARFAGWLHGIVRHTGLRALKEMAQLRSMADDLRRQARPEPQPPDEVAEETERLELVRSALGRLGTKNREAVSLYYVDGLSYSEIAGFLGVTEVTVQGRLQRARVTLRKELEMVEETFKERELPGDFSEEVRRLLDARIAGEAESRRAIQRLVEIGAPAVDPLLAALDDPRKLVRRVAARILCQIGDARALPVMLRALFRKAADPWMANVLYSGRLLAVPGARDALLAQLKENDSLGHWVAIRILSLGRGDQKIYDALLAFYRNPEQSVYRRYEALSALCNSAPESASELLAEAATGANVRLRGWALLFASRHGVQLPLEACLRIVRSTSNAPSGIRAGELALQHGEAGRQGLERLMREGTETGRVLAAGALARNGSQEAIHFLIEELARRIKDRRSSPAVSDAPAQCALDELPKWMADHPQQMQRMADLLWTLAWFPLRKTTPIAERVWRGNTRGAGAAALRILARQMGDELVTELRQVLREGKPVKVAREAFWAMHKLRDAAIPTVREMLESEHWTERKAAVCLLRRWNLLADADRAHALKDQCAAVRLAIAQRTVVRHR